MPRLAASPRNCSMQAVNSAGDGVGNGTVGAVAVGCAVDAVAVGGALDAVAVGCAKAGAACKAATTARLRSISGTVSRF